jgi:hypothetical protein
LPNYFGCQDAASGGGQCRRSVWLDAISTLCSCPQSIHRWSCPRAVSAGAAVEGSMDSIRTPCSSSLASSRLQSHGRKARWSIRRILLTVPAIPGEVASAVHRTRSAVVAGKCAAAALAAARSAIRPAGHDTFAFHPASTSMSRQASGRPAPLP